MRRVRIMTFNSKDATGAPIRSYSEGYLLGYGVSYEELTNGVGSYTVALVEMDDGTVCETAAAGLQFVEPTPPPPNKKCLGCGATPGRAHTAGCVYEWQEVP